MLFETACVVHI